jgi:hypothetical protein
MSDSSAACAIDDRVIRLREWSTDTVHSLTGDDRGPLTIGTSGTCAIRLRDPSRRVAPEHARIERSRGRLRIVDLGSKHGLLVGGIRHERVELRSGMEISLGGAVTLIAESQGLIALREALARILGWRRSRRAAVDLALRQVCCHVVQRSVLVLIGGDDEHDLASIAEALHRLTLTEKRPFILYNPRRINTLETVKNPIRAVTDIGAALAEADGGTLCLLHHMLPQKLTALLTGMMPRDRRIHLVVCVGGDPEDTKFGPPSLVVPPLSSRRSEIDRLITEYVTDAELRLSSANRIRLSPVERAWLRTSAGESLPELQKATLRLVALREAGTPHFAARLLGIAPVTLRRWLERREYAKLEAVTTLAPRRSPSRPR